MTGFASTSVGIVATALQLGAESVLLRPKRSIGSIVLQVTLEEQHQDDLEVTDHPVERGAVISDHAFKRPASVTIRGAFSASPSVSGLIDGLVGNIGSTLSGVTSILSGGSTAKSLSDRYDALLTLQSQAIPFDIYTGKRQYKNMLMTGLSTTTERGSENTLIVSMTCREVILVSTSIVSVPTDTTRQADPGSTAAPVSSGVKVLQGGGNYVADTPGQGFVGSPQAGV